MVDQIADYTTAGFDAVVPKPIRRAELEAVLQRLSKATEDAPAA